MGVSLVIGASGAIGSAFVESLTERGEGPVWGLHRRSDPPLDLLDDAAIAASAEAIRSRLAESSAAGMGSGLRRLIVATGVLSLPEGAPEKRLADLNGPYLERVFRLNTIGPALVLRHFLPLLDRQCGVAALLSAKVGSIGDNRLGGWYGYRASKAALNMLVKTAAIELRRTHPGAAVVVLHPGTVRSGLSRPFRGDEIGREPAAAAGDLLAVLDGLDVDDSGAFLAYDGQALPW